MAKSNNYTELPYMGGALIVSINDESLDKTFVEIRNAALYGRTVYLRDSILYMPLYEIAYNKDPDTNKYFVSFGAYSFVCDDVNDYPGLPELTTE